MEFALASTPLGALMETMSRDFIALQTAWDDFVVERHQKKEAQQRLATYLSRTERISDLIPVLTMLLDKDCFTPTAYLYQSAIVWMIRDIHSYLSFLRRTATNTKNLNGAQFKQVKEQMRTYGAAFKNFDKTLAGKTQFPLDSATYLSHVGDHTLFTPLRIFIDDDDTGKHVSCFEIPQIYGFGETTDEALLMLSREILSMRAELNEDTPVSSEYEALKDFLDLVLGNEK